MTTTNSYKHLEAIGASTLREALATRKLVESATRSSEPNANERRALRTFAAKPVDLPYATRAVWAKREYRDAFWAMMRNAPLTQRDRDMLHAGERRDLSDWTGTAGGYSVPQQFQQKLTESLKYASAVRKLANVMETPSGAKMVWPATNDTATAAAIVTENTAAPTADPVFTQNVLWSFPYAFLERYPIALFQDSTLDIEAVLATLFAARINRGQEPAFLTGAGGGNAPLGMVPNATVAVTTASNSAIAIGELESLIAAVDPAYHDDAAWLMHPNTAKALRGIADAQGRPVFSRDAPLTPWGFRVIQSNFMPQIGSATTPVLFGSFSRFYTVRDVEGDEIIRLKERFADYAQFGLVYCRRSDGTIDDVLAVKSIQCHV